MENSIDSPFFTMLKETVEKHGCKIVDIDFENHNINLDGPDEAVEACSMAIANMLKA